MPNIIKGMRTTIAELTRQNREVELKLHFAERQKKSYLQKIRQLYEEQVRGDCNNSGAGGSASSTALGAIKDEN